MTLKKPIFALSTGAVAGFIIGNILIHEQLHKSLHNILSNQYFHYKFFRLIALKLHEPMGEWLKYTLGFAVLFLILWLIGKLLFIKIAELFIKERKTLKLIFICFVCSIFFVFLALVANHFWLPSGWSFLTLIADTGVLLLAVLFGWFLMKTRWLTLYKPIKGVAIFFLFFLITANIVLSLKSRKESPGGPNILLIVVDTLRADHLSCYEYSRRTTPNIDRLSLDSFFFKNAISAAPWTTPSIASILTSQYPAVLGIEDHAARIENKFLSIAEVFQENNFKTMAVISHAYVSSVLNFNQGFETFDEENVHGEGYVSSPSITNKAIAFLENNKNTKSFLFLHYFDPHNDYILHEKYNYYPEYKGPLYSGQPIADLQKKAPHMSADDIKYLKALYDSEISFTDEYIGKLIDKMKELDLYDNTLIVLTSDHGEEFSERGNHHIGHEKTLYQELIHVPLMIKLPGNNKQHIVEEYVGLIDLMPTVLNFAGLSVPSQYEHSGKVLNLKDTAALQSNPIISETKRAANLQSVTAGGWKAITALENNSKELYDLKKDPAELKNAARELSIKLKELDKILKKWNNYIKLKGPKTKGEEADFTEEQKEMLRSLGYVR